MRLVGGVHQLRAATTAPVRRVMFVWSDRLIIPRPGLGRWVVTQAGRRTCQNLRAVCALGCMFLQISKSTYTWLPTWTRSRRRCVPLSGATPRRRFCDFFWASVCVWEITEVGLKLTAENWQLLRRKFDETSGNWCRPVWKLRHVQ